MGVIKGGSISGILPSSSEVFAVHYPGYPSSTDRAIETLGGDQGILKGQSIYTGRGVGFTSLFYPGDDDASTGVCEDVFLRRSLMAGKIALCFTTFDIPSVTSYASFLVRLAGGVGVIVSKHPNEITSRCRNFPVQKWIMRSALKSDHISAPPEIQWRN